MFLTGQSKNLALATPGINVTPSSTHDMADKEVRRNPGDTSSQYSRTSTGNEVPASARFHPAIQTEDGGRILHIHIYFTPSSPNTLYREKGGKEYIEPGNLLDVLGDYHTFAHFITLCIFFQESRNESVELKKEQGRFIEELAGVMNHFYRIRKLDVCLSLPTFSWGQMKNAASFYPLRFTRWFLHQKLGNREWVQVQPNSNLQKRLNDYVSTLLDEEEKGTEEKTKSKAKDVPTHEELNPKQTKNTGKGFRQSIPAKQNDSKKKGKQ